MSEERRKILYETLEEIANYHVSVQDWVFKIGFQTNLYDQKSGKIIMNFASDKAVRNASQKLVLEIKNVPLFEDKINTYLDAMREFLNKNPFLYDEDNIYYDGDVIAQEKYFLATLWSNASFQDFKDPLLFIAKRIQYLKDDSFPIPKLHLPMKDSFKNFDDISLVYEVKAQHTNLETPYVFKSQLEDQEGNSYLLPIISFGIAQGKCFIYSIRDIENHDRTDSFYKKVKRSLYQVNKDVSSDYFSERIVDVSPSSICSLALFLGLMHQRGITDYEVIPYLPLRYQAKMLLIEEKIKKLQQKSSQNHQSENDIDIEQQIDFFYQNQDRLQENITNKFLRNFQRIAYHLQNVELVSYPSEMDDALHFKIPLFSTVLDDNLVGKLYHKTSSSIDTSYQNPKLHTKP